MYLHMSGIILTLIITTVYICFVLVNLLDIPWATFILNFTNEPSSVIHCHRSSHTIVMYTVNVCITGSLRRYTFSLIRS